MRERLAARHKGSLAELLRATREFTAEDVEVALELIDEGIKGSDDYRFWVDAEGDRVRGYVCFGPTAMTRGTYDLYWICVDPLCKGQGVGRDLVREMEKEIAPERARLIRVETAGSAEYAATRAFYDHIGFEVVARIKDFYWPGNDLVIYGRYLEGGYNRES